MMTDRKMINTEGVRELLGISKNTVTAWVRMGKLPSPVKIGAENKWREADVLACLDMLFQKAKKNVRKVA
jgi:predicted DNA-binding transcriptional regulator AlpA